MTDLQRVLDASDKDFDNSVERLFELLRLPSISADPAYKGDCRKAGQWLVDYLNELGFKATLHDTPGQPMVVAHYTPPHATTETPHVLFYGHYDVQPVDPVELWHSPPFEPVKKTDDKGKVKYVGRGTADDKGQLMTFIEAARAWIKTAGSLPIKATFLIEGEEESGSPSLVPFMQQHKQELTCDAAFVCDTNMWDEKTPAITTRLRGMVHEEVTITGPRLDLHSGLYGGAAINPIRVLSGVIAALHDKNGKVTIPGFYEGVSPLPAKTRKQWQGLKFNERKFLSEIGLKYPAGEKGKSVLEQIWARPTAEVNGIWGGYTGEGTKTVIPSKAQAKFSFRLVGKQNPLKILKAFQKFVKAHVPKDCKVSFASHGSGNFASEVNEDNLFVRKSAQALKDEFKREAIMMGSGGSIPIVGHFKNVLGMDTVLVGFGLNDDAIHSPNEKYDENSYHKGIRSWIRVMDGLAKD